MGVRHAPDPVIDAERLFEGFENLMPFRVQDILLVSSLYDSFILREDGRLNELLIDESLELNLQQIPGITHVSNCAEALARSEEHTSELQSQSNLVCRLLLEKKKTRKRCSPTTACHTALR